jgi:hypothetical protein
LAGLPLMVAEGPAMPHRGVLLAAPSAAAAGWAACQHQPHLRQHPSLLLLLLLLVIQQVGRQVWLLLHQQDLQQLLSLLLLLLFQQARWQVWLLLHQQPLHQTEYH